MQTTSPDGGIGNGNLAEVSIIKNRPANPWFKEPEAPADPDEWREPSDPSGYMFDSYGEQHVVYRGTENHIHELRWDASAGWRHTDLTNVTGAPEAWGNPSGYVFKAQGTQHVILWVPTTTSMSCVGKVRSGGYNQGYVFGFASITVTYRRRTDSNPEA